MTTIAFTLLPLLTTIPSPLQPSATAPGGHPPARFQPTSPFRPARGIRSPHLQSMVGAFVGGARRSAMRRERWPSPDRGELRVDTLSAPPTAPHLLVLHGLGGSPRSPYVGRIVEAARDRGWGVVAPELRATAVNESGTTRAFHVGGTGDVRASLEHLTTRVAGPIAIVGFSMGANLTLKLMGELGASAPASVRAAAAVSPPLDVGATAERVDRPGAWNALYRRGFLFFLRRPMLAREARLPAPLGRGDVRRPKTLTAFDDALTAPLLGFKDGASYHANASSEPWLPHIVRPTLVLASLDDPVIPYSPRSVAALHANPWLSPVVTAEGGHFGFVDGSLLRPRSWSTEQIFTFLTPRLTE
jgi:predicted alpha/beta-fold hydrolase